MATRARTTAVKKSRKPQKEEEFVFVIARPWKNSRDGLCVYTYFTELQRGTLSQAKKMLEYVQMMVRNPKKRAAYNIYIVSFTKIS